MIMRMKMRMRIRVVIIHLKFIEKAKKAKK